MVSPLCVRGGWLPTVDAKDADSIELRQLGKNAQEDEGRGVDYKVDRIVLGVETGQDEAEGQKCKKSGLKICRNSTNADVFKALVPFNQ